jgi:hypothetical protein
MHRWQRALIYAWETSRVALIIFAVLLIVVLLAAIASHLPPSPYPGGLF